MYSDDNGKTWSSPTTLITTSSSVLRPRFYQMGKIYVAWTRARQVFYITSIDETEWSNLIFNSVLPFSVDYSTILNLEENKVLFAASLNGTSNSTLNLYSSGSLSQTAVYQYTILETDSGKFFKNLYGLKMNNVYWLAFTLESDLEGIIKKDIYFIVGDSTATLWAQPVLFAKSYRNDDYPVLSELTSSPFINFASDRFNTQDSTQIFYGQLDVSEDINFPPYLKKVNLSSIYNYPVDLVTTTLVKSFSPNQLLKVTVFTNVDELMQLYDDGVHNDGLANDSIFGNTVVIPLVQNNLSIYAKVEDIYNYSSQVFMGSVNPEIVRNDDVYTFTNSNSRFSINRNGVIANVLSERLSTAFDGRSIIFSGGFLLSGISNGNGWANGIATESRIEDYVSGIAGGTESRLFVVKKSDLPFSDSWQNWSDAVALGANFYDGNGDGDYTPVDFNSNGKWDSNEDAPDILGDETVWCVYNDGVPSSSRQFNDIEPKGIEIRQTVWDYSNDDNLKNVYFIRYSILNTGTVVEEMDSVYFGLGSDPDNGYWNDDFVGCDSLLNSGYCYGDANDDEYGSNSPAVFQTLLQGPWKYVSDNTQFAINFRGYLLGTDTIYGAQNLKSTSFVYYMCGGGPKTAQEARFFLLGKNEHGDVINPCDWVYGIVTGMDCSTIDGHWVYSGDPVDSIGWLDSYGCDKRMLLNTGPFQLKAGKPIDIIAAYHFERGNTNIESVILGKEKVQYLFNNMFVSVSDQNSKENMISGFKLFQNYPNPFNPATKIRYSIPKTSKVEIKIFNILGQEIAILVDEKKSIGSYEISWDAQALPSGIYFYKIRANDFIQTRKMILLK